MKGWSRTLSVRRPDFRAGGFCKNPAGLSGYSSSLGLFRLRLENCRFGMDLNKVNLLVVVLTLAVSAHVCSETAVLLSELGFQEYELTFGDAESEPGSIRSLLALPEDFESYDPGVRLVPQSAWLNPVDSGDTVLDAAAGIEGQSGAHVSSGSGVGGRLRQVLRAPVAPAHRTISFDLRIDGTDTVYMPFASSGDWRLKSGIGFFIDQNIAVLQRNPITGDLSFVTLSQLYTPAEVMRIDLESSSTGSLLIRMNGRVVFAGRDLSEGANFALLGGVGLQTDNFNAGDRAVIDNISEEVTTIADPEGTSDLLFVMGAGTLQLFDPIVPWDNLKAGQEFQIGMLAWNTSELTPVPDAVLRMDLPDGLEVLGFSCAGEVVGNVFLSDPIDIAPSGVAQCDVTVGSSADLERFLVVNGSVESGTVPDPYLENNEKRFIFVYSGPEIFGDRFEIE